MQTGPGGTIGGENSKVGAHAREIREARGGKRRRCARTETDRGCRGKGKFPIATKTCWSTTSPDKELYALSKGKGPCWRGITGMSVSIQPHICSFLRAPAGDLNKRVDLSASRVAMHHPADKREIRHEASFGAIVVSRHWSEEKP